MYVSLGKSGYEKSGTYMILIRINLDQCQEVKKMKSG